MLVTMIHNVFSIVNAITDISTLSLHDALPISAYQDYTIRAKVSELILAGSSARTTVTEQAQNLNGLTSSGRAKEIASGGKTRAAMVSLNGIIELTGADANIMGTSGILVTLQPS